MVSGPGFISPCAGYALYQKLRNEVLQKLPPPSCVVYLSAPAEVCHQRIMIRGRVSANQASYLNLYTM